MCGIAGYLTQSCAFNNEDVLHQMGDAINHRGPDDEGVWLDKNAGIGLVHRRLSIVDLSAAGHQPMFSATGRYVLVFNGEIYNHLVLRERLPNVNWVGRSDTETFLASIERYGLETTLKNSQGMFAFALWDRKERTLHLARDRVGEKPLYYGFQDGVFLFGSELKALKKNPHFKAKINRGSIALYIRHNYIPTPYTIYQGVFKLEPGCLLMLSDVRSEPKIWSYWSASDVALTGVNNSFRGTPDEAVNELENLCKQSIQQQMMADVPLGAFLSGGIDSSLVVALMQSQSTCPIKTFTIGFHEEGYNEAVHAKAVARHLGTEHTEFYVTPEEAMEVIPRLSSLYCEPFSDSSQIPTFLISQLAKQHVSVSLSGDAGDELFCGYNRYQMTNNLWPKLSMLPVPLRALVAKRIVSISPLVWNRLYKFIPGAPHFNNLGDKLHKGAGVLTSRSVDELYLGLVSHIRTPEKVVIGSSELPTLLTGNAPDLSGLSDVQWMMALDLVTYLPDDILVKVDRAAMGVSLETRVPYLDHRVVEFAWKLPLSIKIRNGQSKWVLRQVLYKYVPKELIERPKMGFGVPIDSWLRGPLRDWAENLLDESRLRREGYFYPIPIRKKWDEHLSGQCNWQHYLWNILMFQSWLETEQ
jgi:asparagine synthase (glutamine-hydrolysing)